MQPNQPGIAKLAKLPAGASSAEIAAKVNEIIEHLQP